MKQPNTFFSMTRATVMLLCFTVACLQSSAQSSAAAPQPVKKTNTAPATSSSTNKPAPWEVQRIEPAKNKPATSATKVNTKPEQPQPIQHK